jgi:hypothetical protein
MYLLYIYTHNADRQLFLFTASAFGNIYFFLFGLVEIIGCDRTISALPILASEIK